MNKKMKNGLVCCIMVLLLSFLGFSPVRAAVIWTEEFDTLDDWELYAYETVGALAEHSPVLTKLLIVDGELTRDSSAVGVQLAYHNSSIAYGTWSFDWIVDPGTEGTLIVNFIQNNHYPRSLNVTGVQYQNINYTGYAIYLTSQSSIFNIEFSKWENTDNITIGHKVHTEVQLREDGIHYITIRRDSTGNFTIERNSEVVMTLIDNDFTTSEYFNLVLWGKAKIDNIVVDDTWVDSETTTTTTTQTFPSWTPLMVLMAITALIIIRKKR
ncbi:MAG: hypothetical protein ACXAC6_18070 [Candidatus Hodarchaeales archaeon]|jgi:hypothetical protein